MKHLAFGIPLVVALSANTSLTSAQSVGALQVFDSQGRVIGRYLPVPPGCDVVCDTAAAGIVTPTISFLFPIRSGGFTFLATYGIFLPTLVHMSSDCSGPRFLATEIRDPAGFILPPALVTGGKLIIPIARVSGPFNSREVFAGDPGVEDWRQPGICDTTVPPGGRIPQ